MRTSAIIPAAWAPVTSMTARSSEWGACSMSITTKSKPAWASSWIASSDGSLTHVPRRPAPLPRTSANRARRGVTASETMLAHPREQQLGDFIAVEIGKRDMGVTLEASVGQLEHFHLTAAIVDRLLELQAEVVEVLPPGRPFEVVTPHQL